MSTPVVHYACSKRLTAPWPGRPRRRGMRMPWIALCHSGRARLHLADTVWPLRRHDVLVLPGGVQKRIDPEPSVELSWCYVDGMDLPRLTAPRRLTDALLRSCFQRLVWHYQRSGGRGAAVVWLAALVQGLHELQPMETNAGPAGGLDRAVLAQASAIDLEPWRSWCVQNLATRLGCSSSHLQRRWKALLGLAPRTHISRARLAFAAELLRTGPESIERIAHQAGFHDRQHLARQFRTRYGVTPDAWRHGSMPPPPV